MELFLGSPDSLEIIPVGMHLFNGILVDGKKAFYLKNIGNNEVSTNESLPFHCAQHSCVCHSRTLILQIVFLKLELRESVLTRA
jgi:hypothetical protein